MPEWDEIAHFQSYVQYIATERAICNAIWDQEAQIYITPVLKMPELEGILLTYEELFLVELSNFRVWRLLPPTEKGGGSFMSLGTARRKAKHEYPIDPRHKPFKLQSFIDLD